MSFAMWRQFPMGIGLGRGSVSQLISYLLRETFGVNRTAGTLGGQTIACAPGPGSLTYVDTEGKLSVVGGKLSFAGGKVVPEWGDPAAYGQPVTRAAGVSILATLNLPYQAEFEIGFDISMAGSLLIPFYIGTDIGVTASIQVVSTFPIATDFEVALILRASGEYYFSRTLGSSAWTLLWVNHVGTDTPLYPAVVNRTKIGAKVSNLRVLSLADLDARFSTNDGLATSVLLNPAAGATATMTPDAVIESVFNYTLGGNGWALRYRRVDVNNNWYVYADPSGSLTLNERLFGVNTQRIAGSIGTGTHRVIVVADGATHSMYLDNVKVGSTYIDPNSSHITATELLLGESGVNTPRLAAFPRLVTMPGGV